jgi:hypothetical protein
MSKSNKKSKDNSRKKSKKNSKDDSRKIVKKAVSVKLY